MRNVFIFALATIAAFAPAIAQEKRGLFFHLEAIEYNETETPNEVKLNIPMSLIRAFQPNVDQALADVDFGEYHQQFRLAWQEIKGTGPFTVVELIHEDTTLRVSTTKTHIVINATGPDYGNAVARIPLSIGDALFNMGQSISFDQLLSEIEALAGQELITVESDKVDLRIWVD